MSVFISTAAGLLAADAICKKRSSKPRKLSMSSSSSSSDQFSLRSPPHRRRSRHRQRRRPRNPSLSSHSTQSSPSALEASTTSLSPSSEQSESEPPSSNSSSNSDTDSSESTVTQMHRICRGRLPKHIKHRSQLPDYHTLMTKYVPPDRWSSSDTSSNSDTSVSNSAVTVTSSSDDDSDSSDTTLSDSESSSTNDDDDDSDSDSESIDSNSSSAILSRFMNPPPLTTHPSATDASTLQSRLSTFLPAIHASNAQLEREHLAGTLDKRNIEYLIPPKDEETSGDKEKPYIEMNLGLGVLEEKGLGDTKPVRVKRERSRESETRRVVNGGEDALGMLMGRDRKGTLATRDRKRRKVGIEVVD
ncbi:MAG: hypothetical protein Q9213_003599 [Squamulea squamosa]